MDEKKQERRGEDGQRSASVMCRRVQEREEEIVELTD